MIIHTWPILLYTLPCTVNVMVNIHTGTISISNNFAINNLKQLEMYLINKSMMITQIQVQSETLGMGNR